MLVRVDSNMCHDSAIELDSLKDITIKWKVRYCRNLFARKSEFSLEVDEGSSTLDRVESAKTTPT